MRLMQRVTRAYHLWCARDDVRRQGVVVPAGVWACAYCPRVTFDAVRLSQHMAGAHA
jgi:hypothetical protein